MAFVEILQDYPNLTKDDIKAALEYSAGLVRGDDIIPEIKGKYAASDEEVLAKAESSL